MDNVTREYINKVADSVRTYYKIKSPVNDMVDVVHLIGGIIEEKVNFDNYCDGSIKKSGQNSFSIVISPFQNEQRKNFTIAHELGHLFLHMGYRTNVNVWNMQDEIEYRRFGSSEQEYQANEFAAALLMPKDDYINTVYGLAVDGKVNMKSVAEKFNVSLSAAINRGRFLGLIA